MSNVLWYNWLLNLQHIFYFSKKKVIATDIRG